MRASLPQFRAVADPTRRQLLDRLREGERGVSELCSRLPLSQPAISQHLKVLREAGLVAVRAEGKRRIYSLQPRALRPIHDWLAHLGGLRGTASDVT